MKRRLPGYRYRKSGTGNVFYRIRPADNVCERSGKAIRMNAGDRQSKSSLIPEKQRISLRNFENPAVCAANRTNFNPAAGIFPKFLSLPQRNPGL